MGLCRQAVIRYSWYILPARSRPQGKDLTKAAKKEAKRKAREFVTKADLEKMFADQAKAITSSSGKIEKAIINRPIIVPTTKDTTGYIKKTTTLHERIIFESWKNLKWQKQLI